MKNIYLLVILEVLAVISVSIGAADLMNDEVNILLLSRVTRVIAVILAGMGMSIAGVIMQQLSRNKFAAPTTATTVDAAKFGVVISLILFPASGSLVRMVTAFAAALLGTLLFMTILQSLKQKNTIFVPLIGIMLGSVIDAVTTVIAYRYDLVQNISTWMMGNFSMVIKGRYELLYLSIPLLVVAYLYAQQFTIAGMGEDFATNLALNYHLVVNTGVAIVALITALVIITVGRIPFLGLVVPNIVALYKGDNLRNTIITTALFGAVFLLVCDIFSRIMIYPYEIPIGLTVGVVGSIIFLYLVVRRRGQ